MFILETFQNVAVVVAVAVVIVVVAATLLDSYYYPFPRPAANFFDQIFKSVPFFFYFIRRALPPEYYSTTEVD